MGRPLYAEMSTGNLLHNLSVLRERAAQSRVLAMVKANAYGHGAAEVALRLEPFVEALGVTDIGEALLLREAGVRAPVVLMEGVFVAEENV